MAEISLPREAADVAAYLRASVPRAWLVGGCVRDALMGRPIQDVDVATPDALAVAQAYAAATGGTYVLLHDAFPTAAVIDRGTGRRVDFCELHGASIEEDLLQRDFTIDALAVCVGRKGTEPFSHDGRSLGGSHSGEKGSVPFFRVIDPTGGIADLDDRRLRMVSAKALDADPLRMLRAFRLAAEIGLEVDPATLSAIACRVERIADPSRERVREELVRLLAVQWKKGTEPFSHDERSPGGSHTGEKGSVPFFRAVDAMIRSGLAAALLSPCTLSADRALGSLEAGDRLVEEARNHPAAHRALEALIIGEGLLPWLRLAFLLGHQPREDVAAQWGNLRPSRSELGALMAYTTPLSPSPDTPRQGAAEAWGLLGGAALGAMLVSAAWDWECGLQSASGGREQRTEVRAPSADQWRCMILALCAEVYPAILAAPLVSGYDLMEALGLEGLALGHVASAVRAAQLAGEVTTPEEAMALARSVAARSR